MPRHLDPFTQLGIWNFGGLSPQELLRRTLREFRDRQLSARCAQFAYFSMLAMMPLLIVMVYAIGQMPIHGLLGSFLTLLEKTLPVDAYQLFRTQILALQQQSSTTYISLSCLIFLYAGSRLFITIGEGLNVAFGHSPRARRARTYWLSLALTFSIALLLLLALILLVIGPQAIEWVIHGVHLPVPDSLSFTLIHWGVVVGFLLGFTSTIYYLVPAHGLPWHWFSPGTVFAVLGWIVASQGFRFYVANYAGYNQIYGTLGGVMAMLFWLYLTGAILLMGAQINGIIYETVQQSSSDTGE
jgi:membrane protein